MTDKDVVKNVVTARAAYVVNYDSVVRLLGIVVKIVALKRIEANIIGADLYRGKLAGTSEYALLTIKGVFVCKNVLWLVAIYVACLNDLGVTNDASVRGVGEYSVSKPEGGSHRACNVGLSRAGRNVFSDTREKSLVN